VILFLDAALAIVSPDIEVAQKNLTLLSKEMIMRLKAHRRNSNHAK
jgi:hypothetical protein